MSHPLAFTMPVKDPDAKLDYMLDYSAWLQPGETITASTWEIPGGLTDENLASFDASTTIVWLSGGTAGVNYRVTNTITTSVGRVDERSFILPVQER